MNIKHNMGMLDRVLRFLIAVIITILYFTNIINGITAMILLVLAVVFMLTSLVSFCPLYLPFNLNTKNKNR